MNGFRKPIAASACAALLLARPAVADGLAERNARLQAWSDDYAEVCYLPEREDGPPELAEIRSLLADAGTFSGYFARILAENDPILCLDYRAPGCRGYFEPKSNVIALLPTLSFPEKLLIAAHELRHTDQASRGYGPSLAFDRRENVRLIFALEADAQALTTLFAWSEKAAGNPEPWETVLQLEHYDDVPVAFANAAATGADAATATRAAFSAWYGSEWRREQYYLSACGHYLDMLDDERAIERHDALPPDYFDRLCRLPDGTDYGCTLTAEIGSNSRTGN